MPDPRDNSIRLGVPVRRFREEIVKIALQRGYTFVEEGPGHVCLLPPGEAEIAGRTPQKRE